MAEERPPAPTPQARKWQSSTPGRQPTAPAARKRHKVFGLLACMLFLAGAAAAWVLLVRPFREPVFRTVSITEYLARQIPVSPLAVQDGETLLQHFRASEQAFDLQQRDLLVRKLQELKEVKPDRSLVLHLSAYAHADEGGVYLLPADASPDDRASWLPMSDVLRWLQDCPARHKLLLLDLMKPGADPRLGQLGDDLAARLQPMLEETAKQDSHLWILGACSPGQVSLVSEDAGQSVFGFYLDEGLRGFADGYPAGQKRNGNITVQKLATFVRARVDRWASRNRGVRQTPFLIEQKHDFDLVALPHGQPRPREESQGAEAYPDWLAANWELRDKAWKAGPPGIPLKFMAPRFVQQFEAELLRAEKRWRGGMDAHRIQEDFAPDVRRFGDEVQLAAQSPPPPTHSLALAVVHGLKVDPATVAAIRAVVTTYDAATAPDPKEIEKSKKKLQDDFKKAAPPEIAAAVWTVAVEEPTLRAEKIQLLNDLLGTLAPAPPRYVETLLLERLAALKVEGNIWPAESVTHAVRALDWQEKAAAAVAVEPRLLPWARTALGGTAAKRREGDGFLFTATYKSLPRATAPLHAAEKQAEQIDASLQSLREAYTCQDDAMMFLPAHAPYLSRLPEEAVDEEKDHLGAVEATRALASLLSASEDVGSDAFREKRDQIERRTTEIRDHLTHMRRPFAAENVRRLLAIDVSGARVPEAIAEIDRLLEAPYFSAQERRNLWNHRRELAQKLHQQTRELDQAEDTAKPWKPTPPPAPFDSANAEGRDRQRALRRARVVVSVLRLGGLSGAEPLESEVGQTKPDDAGLASLGGKLRHAWAQQIPEQVQSALQRQELGAADRLCRALHPFDRDPDGAVDDPARNPTLQLRRNEAAACWGWFAERCRAEAANLAGAASYGDFYRKAAEEFASMAR